ncbi:hypothetical protein KBC75_04130 [Candidatus Shapirobacteria bacterium]|nr:hypothetical protein [Candidatus Shapirobacteria bacterium]
MKVVKIALVIVLILGIAGGVWYKTRPTTNPPIAVNLPTISNEELVKHDGSVEGEKIFIGLNGLVYDVTAGKDFYVTGGDYHYLAGKDSSKDLNMIGGDIIRRKYPVIGKLAQ